MFNFDHKHLFEVLKNKLASTLQDFYKDNITIKYFL
jgi:hypothetical protein